jgi:hypothetical protein
MDDFRGLLFQLMKHGTNTLHVAFVFLFSIDSLTKCVQVTFDKLYAVSHRVTITMKFLISIRHSQKALCPTSPPASPTCC